jgi:hypothetical protein
MHAASLGIWPELRKCLISVVLKEGADTGAGESAQEPSRTNFKKLFRGADAAVRPLAQHSITFTASPPREVSLYLSCMSRPVSRMVLMTLSSET